MPISAAKSKSTRAMKLFSFPLDEATWQQMEAVRTNAGISKAFQIRKGIEMFLATQTDAVKSVPNQKGRKK